MFHVKRFFITLFFIPLFTFSQDVGNAVLQDDELPQFKMTNQKVFQFLQQSYPRYDSMPSLIKEWFYWTNYSRTEPKEFYDNVVRPLSTAIPALQTSNLKSLQRDLYKAEALPMLKPNDALSSVADQFVKEMTSKNAKPSHNSPSGSTFQTRMQSISIKGCAGENLSWGKPNTVLMLVLLYIDQGVSDLGHRKSLLNPLFTEMGVAYSMYKDGKFMVVQDFACNQSN